MNTPYFIIDMNLPGFKVPTSLAHRAPNQEAQEKYRAELNKWRAGKDAAEKAGTDAEGLKLIEDAKPVAPTTVIIPNANVCHDIMKTALTMAVPEGNPDTLRRLQKVHKAIEDGLENGGQLKLTQDDHRFLQSKYAKADKWNTAPDVCKTVIAVQDAITRAAFVTVEKK
jgi:hypothetical protein